MCADFSDEVGVFSTVVPTTWKLYVHLGSCTDILEGDRVSRWRVLNGLYEFSSQLADCWA